MKYMRRFIQ